MIGKRGATAQPDGPAQGGTVVPERRGAERPTARSDELVISIRLRKIHLALALIAVVFFCAGYLARPYAQFAPLDQLVPPPRAAAPIPTVAAQAARPQATPAPTVNPSDPSARITVDVSDAPYMGPNNAPVTILEFSDFQCPFCKRFRDQTLDQLLKSYEGKVKFAYREFPISSLHPPSPKASEAAKCAQEQGKFWPMHDALYASQSEWGQAAQPTDVFKAKATEIGLDRAKFDECLDKGKYTDAVNQDLRAGASYGVQGTPTFFVNGRRLVGAQSLAAFKAVIDEELASAGS